jgi:hypothetical protein
MQNSDSWSIGNAAGKQIQGGLITALHIEGVSSNVLEIVHNTLLHIS